MIDKPFLFSFLIFRFDQPKYVLIYAEDEEKARIKGSKILIQNNGDNLKPEDLKCHTIS